MVEPPLCPSVNKAIEVTSMLSDAGHFRLIRSMGKEVGQEDARRALFSDCGPPRWAVLGRFLSLTTDRNRPKADAQAKHAPSLSTLSDSYGSQNEGSHGGSPTGRHTAHIIYGMSGREWLAVTEVCGGSRYIQ